MAWAQSVYPEQDDFILLGDLNADCEHATPEQLRNLELRTSKYRWVVPDDSNSNVGGASCAYARIIISQGAFDDYAGEWGTNRWFEYEDISNRRPVWASFHTHEDRR